MRILVTGGCGFIGHHIVEHIMKTTDWEVVVIDKLNYASQGFQRLRGIDAYGDKRLSIFTLDLINVINYHVTQEIGQVDYIIHAAAETHVNNSVKDPYDFIMSNIMGTYHILEFARKQSGLKKMVHVSTDEVFGPAAINQQFQEWDRYNCTNPYSATKAGAEELCLAYASSYKIPVVIVHPSNAFGERQHIEKFIPTAMKNILLDMPVNIHVNDQGEICSRYWIHARNIADALIFLLEKGEYREKFNIIGEKEINVLDIAELIAALVNKKLKFNLVKPNEIRPGNDQRYDIEDNNLKAMGWRCPVNFETSFNKTILWTLENQEWLS